MADGFARGSVFPCFGRCCLGAALALLAACSSGGKGGARGGAGSSGGSTGEGGAGGVGGSGAATSAADAAVERGVDGKSGDAMTAEQACQAVVRGLCQRTAVCGGTPDDWQSCAEVAAACPEYFFNSGSTRTVAGVEACLGELAQKPCTDLEMGLIPSCWSAGTRPAGAACAYGSACASRSCQASSDGTCGTCRPGPAATGASCVSLLCGPDDFCHPATKLCTPGSTVVHAANGQPCDLSASPVVGCVGDLECIAPFGQSAGICQPMPFIEVGQPCYQVPGICRPPNICFTLADGKTNPSECRAPDNPVPLACGTAPCDDASFCKTVGGKRTCVPKAAVGEACTGDGGGVTTPCVTGAFCVGRPGVCTKHGVHGDPCTPDTQTCGPPLICNNGHCARLGDVCP